MVRRGDPDAGTVLVKLNRFEAGVTVYTQASTLDDEPAWSRGTGPTPVAEADAEVVPVGIEEDGFRLERGIAP